MTFEAYETSARGGRPVHLFTFARQSVVWRFASSNKDVVVDGVTYTAATIERSEIKQTAEKPQDQITITFAYTRDPDGEQPPTQGLGDNWFPYVPSDVVRVACMAMHLDDPDQDMAVEWLGRVGQPEFTDGTLKLICVPRGSQAKTLRRGFKWQRACPKSTYSTGLRGCNLIAGPIEVAGTLTAVSDSDVTAAEFTAQQLGWVGGTAEWDTPDPDSTHQTANITAAVGTTLTLDNVTGLGVGSEITAYTASLSTRTELTDTDGLTLTSADFADAPFDLAGGSLSWTRSNGIVEQRPIMAHSGSDITILYGGVELAVGLAVTATPDCPHTWAACTARNNTIHYGGSLYEPVQDPYDGQSMSWS